MDDVAELDGGFEGPEGKGCGGVVVELHFYLSSGDVLRGIGIRRELLGIESGRGGGLVFLESQIVVEGWQEIGRTGQERRVLWKIQINCLWHLSQREGEQVLWEVKIVRRK